MISSATSLHHEFHNSTDFKQHFKKRPFDQNFLESAKQMHNVYKKIKTTTSPMSSLLSQQTTNSTKTAPLHSSYMGTNYSPSSGLLYKYIDLRDDNDDVEANSFSNIPRIIDLSTGESLELISPVEQPQKSRSKKRPIESVENQYELSSTIGENKNDLMNEISPHSYKRVRTSKEHMRNFIEEETDSEPVVTKELRTEFNPSSADKTDSVNNSEKPQSSQSLSLCIHGKGIKFIVPYQEAMAKYMRSQFQYLNNQEYKDEGKQVILYCPRNDQDSFVDSCDKIFEIPETMDLDAEAGQTGAVSCTSDEEDQMDTMDTMDID